MVVELVGLDPVGLPLLGQLELAVDDLAQDFDRLGPVEVATVDEVRRCPGHTQPPRLAEVGLHTRAKRQRIEVRMQPGDVHPNLARVGIETLEVEAVLAKQ